MRRNTATYSNDTSLTCVDLEEQNLKSFKQLLKKQARKSQKLFPYKCTCIVVILLLIGMFTQSVWQSYSRFEELRNESELQSQQCFLQYEKLGCKTTQTSQQCRKLVKCLKNKQLSITFMTLIRESLVFTLQSFSSLIIGPTLIAVALILMKMKTQRAKS